MNRAETEPFLADLKGFQASQSSMPTTLWSSLQQVLHVAPFASLRQQEGQHGFGTKGQLGNVRAQDPLHREGLID